MRVEGRERDSDVVPEDVEAEEEVIVAVVVVVVVRFVVNGRTDAGDGSGFGYGLTRSAGSTCPQVSLHNTIGDEL